MKILVMVKRVIDPYVLVRLKPDLLQVETQGVKMAMNPFDEIALEEALKLREKHGSIEIVVVTIGTQASAETLRQGLALGADRGILVVSEKVLCSLNIAKILHKIVLQEQPDLVLMGKQSIDGDNNQTPQMLAALLNWPQATFVSNLIFSAAERSLCATREVDSGSETLSVQLPAVVSTDLRLNKPRYATLPNIMKAKQKPLMSIPLDDLGLDLKQHIEVLSFKAPPIRKAGIMVDSVEALVDKLRNEAQVI